MFLLDINYIFFYVLLCFESVIYAIQYIFLI